MTLELCAAAYRKFCKKYRANPKPERRNHWGTKLLARMRLKKVAKTSPGQKRLPLDDWQARQDKIHKVAKKFVIANPLNPEITGIQFDNGT